MSTGTCRKVKAVVIMATLAVSEMHKIQEDVRCSSHTKLMADSSMHRGREAVDDISVHELTSHVVTVDTKFQEQEHAKLDCFSPGAIIMDLGLQEHARLADASEFTSKQQVWATVLAGQIVLTMIDPNTHEQVRLPSDHIGVMMTDPHDQHEAKIVAELMEEKTNAEQMEATMANRSTQEQAKRYHKQVSPVLVEPHVLAKTSLANNTDETNAILVQDFLNYVEYRSISQLLSTSITSLGKLGHHAAPSQTHGDLDTATIGKSMTNTNLSGPGWIDRGTPSVRSTTQKIIGALTAREPWRQWIGQHWRCLGIVVSAILAIWLRPGENDFVSFARYKRGVMSDALRTVTKALGVEHEKYINFWLAAFARSQDGDWYLGVLGRWVYLPCGRGQSLWSCINFAKAKDIINLMVVINVGVWLMWQFVPQHVMASHFVASKSNLQELRLWTLWTAAISHEHFGQLMPNMLSFLFWGTPLRNRIGQRHFLYLLLVAAPCANLWSNRSLGANGLIDAILACSAVTSGNLFYKVHKTLRSLHNVYNAYTIHNQPTNSNKDQNQSTIHNQSTGTFKLQSVHTPPIPVQAILTNIVLSELLPYGGGADLERHIGGAVAGLLYGQFITPHNQIIMPRRGVLYELLEASFDLLAAVFNVEQKHVFFGFGCLWVWLSLIMG